MLNHDLGLFIVKKKTSQAKSFEFENKKNFSMEQMVKNQRRLQISPIAHAVMLKNIKNQSGI